MNTENGGIRGLTLMSSGNNITYTLEDNARFLSTEYKVLLNQTDGYFLRCMKLLYNGQTQFYYLTDGQKPLTKLLPSLEPDTFLSIVANLFNGILDVNNNGFLSCKNIDISFDRIYVDQNTLKVGLVYLPASIHFFSDESSFENELRTGLIKLISNNDNIQSEKTMKFSSSLSNGLMSLQDLLARLKGGSIKSSSGKSNKASATGMLKIAAMNAPYKLIFDVNKDEFLIGKKEGKVDQVINFNKMISRVHCRIIRNSNGYSIIDLESANGTYVNNVKLQANKPHPLKNGDIIRLANSDFQTIIS